MYDTYMIRFFRTLWTALYNMFNDLSIDISGYIAYTCLLALFPFLMLLLSLASYLGTSDIVHTAIQQFYSVLPPEVAEAIAHVVQEITQHPPSSILTLAVVAIVWISSSSIEAIREGINHAYGITEKRSFIFRRLQAIFIVILAWAAFLLASLLLIILPVGLEVWQYLERYIEKIPDLPEQLGLHINFARLLGAYIAIMLSMVGMYKWLPNRRNTLSECLPGAALSSGLWIFAAGLFSLYLQNFARYDVIYGSLGGIIVTLIFFQITAALILFGAHFNRALKRINT